MNKVALHIGSALFNGFSFWMIGNRYADLQNRLFTIFQFVFVARECGSSSDLLFTDPL
jgi:ATP-binding cassette subfamily G (WHITE) protein 2 (SNQ2)